MTLLRSISLVWLWLAAPAATVASVQIEHWTTDNGSRVYHVETHQIPMVQFILGFDAGSARDPDNAAGLSNMVTSMIEEGAADMDAGAISAGFESVGAEYSAGSGRDIAVFELRSLSDREILDRATGILGTIVSKPSFPEDALERLRERILIGLQRRDQSPRSVASRAFFRSLYGNHPYAHPPSGRVESVSRIAQQELLRFHQEYYVGRNAVLVVVGALTPAQARARAEAILGALPAGRKPLPMPEAAPPDGPESVNIEFPSSQTHLLIGQVGIAYDDPDYFPLYVGNHILGGNGLISRLATEIREDRGLAYSVYSTFRPMKRRGPFAINLQTRNDQAELAEGLSLETLQRFIEHGPGTDELEAAKGNIVGGFPLRLSSNGKIADVVLNIAFYDLPLDYMDTFSGKVEAVTQAQVRSAFRRRVLPGRFVRVRVGGG